MELDRFIEEFRILSRLLAFSGTDNMDGLASGISVIVAAMFLVIAMQAYYLHHTENHLSWFGLLSVGLIGANLGFLVYNFHPARVFMGDAGSFFQGFTLAALTTFTFTCVTFKFRQ